MQRLDVLNGNMAAALGAALAKPDVIAAYPITPQTPVVEYLTQFAADKKIDAAMSEVESELSAMSVVTGASLAGSRTFTATASQGLSAHRDGHRQPGDDLPPERVGRAAGFHER